MNAIREQFMALQKYFWMFKPPISNTIYEQESAVYLYINKHLQQQGTVKSQMGTTLWETLKYALDYRDYFQEKILALRMSWSRDKQRLGWRIDHFGLELNIALEM